MERVAALDLLRGTAALSVAVPHFIMLNSAAGWAETVSVLAVEVFFVLSGFVLGRQILRCLHSGQAGDLGIFLARRCMRTIPPYLFALALISVIVGHVELADLARYALYVANLYLAGLSVALQVAVYLGICIVLSAVFYHVFERPILAMRPDYRRPSETAAIEVMPLAARAKSAA
jgi:peptidoglycan/LPS O-acetylase OafA/YrhL